jgi:hypothetical protein
MPMAEATAIMDRHNPTPCNNAFAKPSAQPRSLSDCTDTGPGQVIGRDAERGTTSCGNEKTR